ncbi:hypothetical protein EDL81_04015 [Ehrlichia ruminantium]|nr:hypothetical protein EDL81_04015 [Ehrlichia ruminantium]
MLVCNNVCCAGIIGRIIFISFISAVCHGMMVLQLCILTCYVVLACRISRYVFFICIVGVIFKLWENDYFKNKYISRKIMGC